jgi:hypothetical protein
MQSRTLRGLVVYCTPIQQCRSDIGAESLDHVFGDLRVSILNRTQRPSFKRCGLSHILN